MGADRSAALTQNIMFWLHVAVLALHLPSLLIYFRGLWDQPHYQQFFPFALAFFAFYVYRRVQSFSHIDFRASAFWPNLFLVLSLPPLILGDLIFDLNFMAIGLFFMTASLLGRIQDRKTQLTLLPAALLLLPVVQPPMRLDIRLITWLQQVTSERSSQILDLIGIDHNLQGNTIVMPDGSQFLVEEACSGVQSLFTLLFCALAFSVVQKRGWLRTLLLVAAAVFWAGFMNTVRVVAVCIAATKGWDLAHGTPHALLGYTTLVIGVALLFSTDQLVNFIFGVSNTEEATRKSVFRRIIKWMLPTDSDADSETRRETRKRTSLTARMVVIGICAVAILFALTPIARLGIGTLFENVFYSPYNVFEVESTALPEKLTVGEPPAQVEWVVEDFEMQQRDNNSDWGSRSGMWTMTSPVGRAMVSVDFPFRGYHELSVCYRGNGWQIVPGGRTINRNDPDEPPFVEVEFSKPTGEHAYLIFSLVDKYGNPIEIPTDDILRVNFVQRVINSIRRRLTYDYGPQPQSFQIQLFSYYYQPISDLQKERLRELYLESRRRLGSYVVEKMKEM